MKIRSVKHRGLKRLIENDDPRELRSDLVKRIRNMLTFLIAVTGTDDLQGPPGWRVHRLSGDRAGTWSLSVSGNWRLTFTVENDEIASLDLEDYH